jgi:TPR repeat protein
MATLEQLDEMRRARAGDGAAQIALAKRYLKGDAGLGRNPASAMLWLDTAARNGHEEAWTLLGQDIFLEVAETSTDLRKTLLWFEHAFAAGMNEAGIVFARIVLRHFPNEPILFRKALSVLELTAQAGNAEAQWLLAKHMLPGLSKSGIAQPDEPGAPSPEREDLGYRVWDLARHAAESGIVDAQNALAERAWNEGDTETFLHWALPLARQFIHRQPATNTTAKLLLNSRQPGDNEATLLFRCVLTLRKLGGNDAEISSFVEHAARKGPLLA